jgi:hypothetical protein
VTKIGVNLLAADIASLERNSIRFNSFGPLDVCARSDILFGLHALGITKPFKCRDSAIFESACLICILAKTFPRNGFEFDPRFEFFQLAYKNHSFARRN